jgi:gustatory receptor
VILNTLIYGLSNIGRVFIDPHDVQKSFIGIAFLPTVLKVLIRCICIIWYGDKLRNIQALMPEKYTLEDINKYKIDKNLKWMRTFIKTVILYVSSSFLFYVGEPLKEYFWNNTRIFPFHIIFPFDAMADHLYYPLVLWIGVSHGFEIILMIGNHNILYGFIALFSLEFKILKAKFENLQDKKSKEFADSLKICVDRQNELATCVEEFQNIFSPSFVFEFIASSFIICFTAFQLSTSTNYINMLFNILFCIFSMNQIFILCFFGQMLIDASEGVVDGIYNCGWEDLDDVKLKKSILLAMIKAQKTSKLTVFNISTITLHQFEKVNFNIKFRIFQSLIN